MDVYGELTAVPPHGSIIYDSAGLVLTHTLLNTSVRRGGEPGRPDSTMTTDDRPYDIHVSWSRAAQGREAEGAHHTAAWQTPSTHGRQTGDCEGGRRQVLRGHSGLKMYTRESGCSTMVVLLVHDTN